MLKRGGRGAYRQDNGADAGPGNGGWWGRCEREADGIPGPLDELHSGRNNALVRRVPPRQVQVFLSQPCEVFLPCSEVFVVIGDGLLFRAGGAARAKPVVARNDAEELFVVLHQWLERVIVPDLIVRFFPNLAGDQDDILVVGESGAAARKRGGFEGREARRVPGEAAGGRCES